MGVPPTDPAHPRIVRDPAPQRRTSLLIELPLPPKELQPNRRLGRHFGGITEHKNQAKGDAHNALYAVCGPEPPRWTAVTASVTLIFTDHRERLDDDNAVGWLKHTRDQLAHDLGMNDRHWHWLLPFHTIIDKMAKPGLIIEIYPAE
jgi:hypothetical protein